MRPGTGENANWMFIAMMIVVVALPVWIFVEYAVYGWQVYRKKHRQMRESANAPPTTNQALNKGDTSPVNAVSNPQEHP